MSNCTNDFPTTGVLFDEISEDPANIVFLALGCVLAVLTILLHVEIIIYMKRVGYTRPHYSQRVLLLGLYPVVCVASVVSLIVPTSTTLIDFIIACYISWCIYSFVQMTLDYHGGESEMIRAHTDNKVVLSTPPCCCCCCCILKPITLTKRSLLTLKLLTMQVAFLRPLLMFVAAVLWTDGKYEQKMAGDSSYLYISIISGISTLLSMYGLIVLYRASRDHLRENGYIVKFVALQAMIVLVNLQSVVFNTLAENDIPGCIGTRGPRVRTSAAHHALLVLESFLLCLLARYGYRREEPGIERLAKRMSSNIVANENDGLPTENKPAYGAHTNHAMESETE